jgi:hypothetical protein
MRRGPRLARRRPRRTAAEAQGQAEAKAETAVTGWAVTSVWRGDRLKLGRIAAAMEDETGGRAAGRARVEIDVLGDHEEYRSFSQFRLEAPEQTTKAFDELTLTREAVVVTLRRRPPTGVVVIGADDRVAKAVARGGLQWVWARPVPILGRLTNTTLGTGDGPDPLAELERRNAERRKLMWAWTAFWVFFAAAVLYGVLRPVSEAPAGELAAVTAGLLLLAAALGSIRPVRDFALPPVEIGDRTPGRRLLGRLIAVGGPVAAAVVKAVTG